MNSSMMHDSAGPESTLAEKNEQGSGVLTMRQQGALAPKVANSFQGSVRKSMTSNGDSGDLFPLLSTGEIHLECWIQIWSLQYRRDTDVLE